MAGGVWVKMSSKRIKLPSPARRAVLHSLDEMSDDDEGDMSEGDPGAADERSLKNGSGTRAKRSSSSLCLVDLAEDTD
eukprot:g39553.t1